MLELNFVASIAERDVDLLILEELSVSGDFRDWFSTRTFARAVFESEIGAWHSVSDAALGESDLVFIFKAVDGSRSAILIENKIDAPPQLQQGKRYRLRGEKGIEDGLWETFRTCVVAPAKYLTSAKHSENYDVEIGYEEIMDYFQCCEPTSTRFDYKANVLSEAIEQHRRGYQPELSEVMTQFVEDYYAVASKEFPSLGMLRPKPRPAGSTWIMFDPRCFNKGTRLAHQLTAGYVKIFFDGQADQFENIAEKYRAELPADASIDISGKSVTISMAVDKIDPIGSTMQEQRSQVVSGLNRLSDLEALVGDSN